MSKIFSEGLISKVDSSILKNKYKGPFRSYNGPTGAAVMFIAAY